MLQSEEKGEARLPCRVGVNKMVATCQSRGQEGTIPGSDESSLSCVLLKLPRGRELVRCRLEKEVVSCQWVNWT